PPPPTLSLHDALPISSPNRSERPRLPHQHPTHHQGQPPDSLSRLLNRNLNAHGGPCDHGTFSPRAESPYNASQRGTPAHGGSGSDRKSTRLNSSHVKI